MQSCTIQNAIIGLKVQELNLMGDCYIRHGVLVSIGQLPELIRFGMGHFEHSDIDCDLSWPNLSSTAHLADQIVTVFKDKNLFNKLRFLVLEHNCTVIQALVPKLKTCRPEIFELNRLLWVDSVRELVN